MSSGTARVSSGTARPKSNKIVLPILEPTSNGAPPVNILLKELVRKKRGYIAVQSGTGTGKTLGVPLAILDFSRQQSDNAKKHDLPNRGINVKRIIVCVPTISIAMEMKKLQDRIILESALASSTKRRYTVGYAADRQINYDEKTNIVYATYGHIYLKLLTRTPLNADVLILDEFQKSSIESEMCMRFCRSDGDAMRGFRYVILMSANEINYEDTTNVHIQIDQKPYKVDTLYHKESDKGVNKYPGSRIIYTEAVQVITNYHKKNAAITGTYLVFCPGRSEINQMFKGLDATELFNIEIVTSAERNESPAVSGRRHIILATNVIEMGVTIPDVRVVFDLMREKIPVPTDTGFMRIETRWTTKDNAEQRKGRVGRVMDGTVYRMCNKNLFDRLEKHNRSAFETNSLDKLYIQLLSYGYDPSIITMDTEEMLKERIEASLRKMIIGLKKYKLLDADDKVTEAGLFSSICFLSTRFSSFLYHWVAENKNPYAGTVIACLMETTTRSIYSPGQKKVRSEVGKLEATHPIPGLLKLFNDYYQKCFPVEKFNDDTVVNTFVTDNGLNAAIFKGFLSTLVDSLNMMSRSEYSMTAGRLPTSAILDLHLPSVLERSGFTLTGNVITLVEGKSYLTTVMNEDVIEIDTNILTVPGKKVIVEESDDDDVVVVRRR